MELAKRDFRDFIIEILVLQLSCKVRLTLMENNNSHLKHISLHLVCIDNHQNIRILLDVFIMGLQFKKYPFWLIASFASFLQYRSAQDSTHSLPWSSNWWQPCQIEPHKIFEINILIYTQRFNLLVGSTCFMSALIMFFFWYQIFRCWWLVQNQQPILRRKKEIIKQKDTPVIYLKGPIRNDILNTLCWA